MGERPTGVTVLAILLILFGILTLIFGLISIGALGFVLPWFATGWEYIIVIIEVIWGILYVIGGFGLLSLKNWARILVIIIAVLGLIGGIILIITFTIDGIIIGLISLVFSIIIIWYLMQEEVASYFA